MTDEERQDKNARCDSLLKEGISGRQDDAAVARTCALTDLALELGRKDGINCVLAWYDTLDKKGVSSEHAVVLDYSRANAIAAMRYGTDWQWEQPTLASEIFYLRRAVSNPKFQFTHEIFRCMCLNNLGKRLEVAGRLIEALEYWRRALDVRPDFGMALCNRAAAFASYAEALQDTGKRALFLFAAYNEASAAIARAAVYTDARDEATRERTQKLMDKIKSVLDVKGIAGENPFEHPDDSGSKDERDYRQWCLANCLFLNPSNDLGSHSVAASDCLWLAAHVVPLDAPHIFQSFFDQMMQEYVSARWFLYEGLTRKVPHYSDRDVLLQATEPQASLSVVIESVKAAYRISYSLFDKISFFMNSYMKLGIPEKQVSFRRVWRADEKKPIRSEFDLKGNWAFCALYWLAKDLFDEANNEVAEPQARGISEIRNHIEHKYLRVAIKESPPLPRDDLALTVSRKQFEAKALHLLKLARSALMYLAIGVGFEERRREPDLAGVPIEELPTAPCMPHSEKI